VINVKVRGCNYLRFFLIICCTCWHRVCWVPPVLDKSYTSICILNYFRFLRLALLRFDSRVFIFALIFRTVLLLFSSIRFEILDAIFYSLLLWYLANPLLWTLLWVLSNMWLLVRNHATKETILIFLLSLIIITIFQKFLKEIFSHNIEAFLPL
jgi:hypothetical protein